MSHLRIYVAGPMTGIKDYNFPAFNNAEQRLREAGYDVANPAHNGSGGKWADYVKMGLAQLLNCDGIAVLPRWEDSRGARLEVHVGMELHLPIHPVNEWVALVAV